MGNTHVKPHPRPRNKKQVHWKAAARPPPPGRPNLVSETETTPDVVSIQWTKPLTDGGSPISGYLVEHRRTGSPHWVRATPLLVQGTELTISGLEPGWRYQFRVSAQNAVGISDPSELSEPITVTLQRSAITAPRFTQELEEVTALENEKAEFIVHFLGQPPPKVCWYKDAYEIFSSRRIRILSENDKSILTIHQCALSDEGEIKCTATNRAGHVTTKAKLTVEAPPSIRLPRQYEDGLLFEIGEMIRLKVSVAGRPTPLAFWSHNGESINNNDRYEIEYIDNSSILKISEARREDRGEYQIKAVNQLGEDTQSFLVTVTDKPSPPGRARVVMALGRSVTLSWSRPDDDGGCKVGNYIIEYYRLGWNVWLKAATSRQLTTILGDLIEGSEYKFRVKAESPYGVSEPSDESDVVFIPDPKRGILKPPVRSKSQPRDIPQDPTTPVAARRKNKSRSQSSTRVEEQKLYLQGPQINDLSLNVPKRPERTKIKSPPMSPEISPMTVRKNIETEINRKIFDQSDRSSSSMTRELAYGSPDLRIKKESSNVNQISSNDQSRTPSPSVKMENHKVFTVKINRSTEKIRNKSRSTSPDVTKRKLGRDANESVTGSSEFMLVLYPGENGKGQDDLYFDHYDIPPPMSLSAPELGSELPSFKPIRNSASSTELLHERSMMRLYQASQDEKEQYKSQSNENRKVSVDIPKIQINSKDNEEIIGLQRKHSGRRMSAGGLNQKQKMWTQRRYSLKSTSELKDEKFSKLHKFPENAEDKRNFHLSKQRSESEEREEKIFEEARKKTMNRDSQKSRINGKQKINIAEVEKWADDYVSSTDSETESSEDETKEVINKFKYAYTDEEEADTYHPGVMKTSTSSEKEPFEILTVRKDPPSPDFVPKPILKKTDHEDIALNAPILSTNKSFPKSPPTSPPTSPPKSPSLSPTISPTISPPKSPQIPRKIRASSPVPSRSPQRERSLSLTNETILPGPTNLKDAFEQHSPPKPRQRSFSLLPQKDLLGKNVEKFETPKKSPTESSKPFSMMSSIAEVAKISGITAASIVIPNKLLEKQKDAEEAKVVIDHYGDIVRNYGARRRSNPNTGGNTIKNATENISSSPVKEKDIYSIDTNPHDDSSKDDPLSSTVMNHNGVSQITTFNRKVSANSGYSEHDSPMFQNLSQRILAPLKIDIPEPNNNMFNNTMVPPTKINSISPKNSLGYGQLNSSTYNSTSRTNWSVQSTTDSFENTNSSTNTETMVRTGSSPIRESDLSPLRRTGPSPLRKSDPSPSRKTGPSPLRKSGPSPLRKSDLSPLRKTEQSQNRKADPSPLRKIEISGRNKSNKRTSPSPMRKSPLYVDKADLPKSNITNITTYRPMLREIMTQTSEDPYVYDSDFSRNSTPPFRNYHQDELMARAEIKVRSFMDYLTDLAMFSVACWIYFFSNELYAIPILLFMVYRQLKEEIKKRIPEWIKRKFRKKKTS